MQDENGRYRITAKIRTKDGKTREVSFPGTRDTMERTMRVYFHAVEYQLLRFGEARFSNRSPWVQIQKGGNRC